MRQVIHAERSPVISSNLPVDTLVAENLNGLTISLNALPIPFCEVKWEFWNHQAPSLSRWVKPNGVQGGRCIVSTEEFMRLAAQHITIPWPRVGVGAVIRRPEDGYLLMGKRKGAYGPGEWSLPGGHLEWKEKAEDCCRREVEEETGLLINNIRFLDMAEKIWEGDVPTERHYITLFFSADVKAGIPVNVEPDKCEGWEWMDPANPPEPLFGCTSQLFEKGLLKGMVGVLQ